MPNQKLGSKVAPGSHHHFTLTRQSRELKAAHTRPLDQDGKWQIEVHNDLAPGGE